MRADAASEGPLPRIAVEPVRRGDKRHPNTVATAAGVVASLIDDIADFQICSTGATSGGEKGLRSSMH